MDRELALLLLSLSPGGRDKLLREISAVPQLQETPDWLMAGKATVLRVVLVRITIAVLKHHGQNTWGGNGLFSFYFYVTVHH